MTLADRIFTSMVGAFDLLAIHAGDRLGWYAALADHGPCTPEQLAAATGTDARYAREWLEHQAVGGWLDVDGDRRYSLSAEHAETLLDRDSREYAAPMARAFVSCAAVLPQALDAYRSGGGVPWEAFGTEGVEAQADTNRPLSMSVLPREWLPAIPGVHDRLSQPGARVADVACGGGWSSIGIAEAYPDAQVDGYDVSVESVDLARANAAAAGVGDRVAFHVLDASGHVGDGGYDLVLVLEAIHDMARPVEALATMRALAAPTGTVLVIDERTAETFTAPGDERERALYGFSLFCCLLTGRSETPSAATGTVMRPDTLRGYARDAGFADVEVLPIEDDVFRLYRLV
jgi:2-polyprenyl-3-methyl-5-hydroxy-6-metoxy-1,4-benzoquinol methylase